MIKYNFPIFVVLFLPLIILVILNVFYNNKNKFIYNNIKSDSVKEYIFQNVKYNRIHIKSWLLIIGCFFMIVASIGPQIGTRLSEYKREGIDIFIALDVSESMNAQDVTPNRIEKAKYELNRLINSLDGDRVGIIVFAGTAHIHLPLTTDYSAAKLFLKSIDTKIVETPGTSLSSVMNLAIDQIQKDNEKYKAIILVSDGEDHEGEAIEIAKIASDRQILFYTVGVGTIKGSPIPILSETGKRINFKKNNDGKIVTTILNEQILNKISNITGAEYYRIDNKANALSPLIKNLDLLDKKELKTQVFTEYEHRYQIFLLLSLICLFVEFLLFTKKKD